MRPAFALLVLALPAPAFGDAATLRQRGDTAIHARAIFKKYCSECHNGQKTFDVLDHAQLMAPEGTERPVPFVNLKNSTRSQVLEFIEDGSMPPGGRKGPTEKEISVLKAWIAAEAPSYPKAFDPVYVQNSVQTDWQGRLPEDYRYISFAHLITDDPGSPNVTAVESRLRSALQNATTKSRVIELDPVDPAATIYRLNVKKLGWIEPDKFQLIVQQKPMGTIEFVALDLIQLEYPFPTTDVEGFAKRVPPSRYAPSVFVYRGDWLGDVLAAESPLAADMRSMVELTDAKEGEEPAGPRIPTMGIHAPAARGATAPLTAWYSDGHPGPFTVDFTLKDRKPPFSVETSEPVPLEATAERTARAVLFNVLSDGSVRQQGTIESILKKGEPFAFRGANGPLRLSLLSGAESAVEHFVLFAGENELPKFSIIRSNHLEDREQRDRSPIWRIVIEQSVKFDSSKVVCKVVQITVTKKK